MPAVVVTISGKGGVGKTTIAALLASEMLTAGISPLLLVDADPAGTLHLALGVARPEITLARVREAVREVLQRHGKRRPGGLTEFLARVGLPAPVLPNLHLLCLGRPEGRGCYCEVNSALAATLREILGNYRWIVVDNEAGHEHLSRVNIPNPDVFLVVTRPDRKAQEATRSIVETARQAGIVWRYGGLILNESRGDFFAHEEILPLWATLPHEPMLEEMDRTGQPVTALPADSPLRLQVKTLAERVLSSCA